MACNHQMLRSNVLKVAKLLFVFLHVFTDAYKTPAAKNIHALTEKTRKANTPMTCIQNRRGEKKQTHTHKKKKN